MIILGRQQQGRRPVFAGAVNISTFTEQFFQFINRSRLRRFKQWGSFHIAVSFFIFCHNSRIYITIIREIINTNFIFYSSKSEEHTSELQSRFDLVCRLLLEKKKKIIYLYT